MKPHRRIAALAAALWFAAAPLAPSAFAADPSQEAVAELRKEMAELREQRQADQRAAEEQERRPLTWRIGIALLIVLGGLALEFALKKGVKRFEEMITEKGVARESGQTLRLKTLSKLFNWTGTIFIFLSVAYIVLEQFGVNVAPLLAGAGIVGVAFGFGGQYLIRDLINGIFILIEEQYRVNDIVKIGDLAGVVEDVNLRITTLRDFEGRVIYIPNGEIKTVVNMTKDYANAVLDVRVAYKENVDRVMDVLREIGAGMRRDEVFGPLILQDLEMAGVDQFADSQVTIRCRIRTLPSKQWDVKREMLRRIKNRFDELGIEIPFPHRTLYLGTAEDNRPLRDWLSPGAAKKP